MDKILIVYWTQTGATENMAKAVEEGAKQAGAQTRCIKVTELQKEDLGKYDAYIWGTGNYFQTIHGMIWDFFDRVHYELLEMPEVKSKPYAFIVSAGVGGAMCLDGLNNRLRELKWKRVFEPVVAFHMPTDEVLGMCRDMGQKMAKLQPDQVVDLNPPKKPRFTWPEDFRIIAWKGVGVEVAKSWTPFLAADTGMKVTVTPEENTVNRFKWTGLKLYQLTALGTSEGSQMVMADRKYAARDTGPFPVRVVWSQSKSASGMIVRGDSPIKTIYDVKAGMRVADMLSYLASQRIVDAFLAWAKLEPKDMAWVKTNNYRDTVMSVVDGRTDIAFGIPTAAAMTEAENSPKGIRWIPMDPTVDPEGYKRYIAIDPLITFGKIPTGVPSSIGVPSNVGISVYVTHVDTHPMMIHRLCRWFDENYPKYKDAHAWNKAMNQETLLDELEHTFVPCHEGLIRYLKEKDLWRPTHEERQTKNVELLDRYCKAYQQAKDMADEKGMPVNPDNAEWITFWENHKKSLGLPPIKLFKSLTEE